MTVSRRIRLPQIRASRAPGCVSTLIKLHHVQHTVASLLKALGVPARDAQVILGHSRLDVTLEVYTHTDDEAQLDALTRPHDLFDQDDEDEAEG